VYCAHPLLTTVSPFVMNNHSKMLKQHVAGWKSGLWRFLSPFFLDDGLTWAEMSAFLGSFLLFYLSFLFFLTSCFSTLCHEMECYIKKKKKKKTMNCENTPEKNLTNVNILLKLRKTHPCT
jgi:hypothetical protein